MGDASDRKKFCEQVRKGCRIAKFWREIGVRPYGVVRIDSACGPDAWYADPAGGTGLPPERSVSAKSRSAFSTPSFPHNLASSR